MSAIRLIARSHLRRHWKPLAALCALCILGASITIGALQAAERTGTALTRAFAEARYPQGLIDVGKTDPALVDEVRRLPDVREAALGGFVAVRPGGTDMIGGIDVVGVLPLDRRAFYEIGRRQVLEGRLPRPDRSDEIALGPWLASELDLGVGDRMIVESYRQAQAFEVFTSAEPVEPEGRRIHAEIVGIGRGLNEISAGGNEELGVIFLSPAVFENMGSPQVDFTAEELPDLDLGFFRLFLQVLLDADQVGPSRIVDPVFDIYDGAASNAPSEDRSVLFSDARDSLAVEGSAFLIVGIVAAIASLFAIGQSAARQVGILSAADDPTLRALGLTRLQRAWAAVLPVVGALFIGTLAGVVLATWSTGLFPRGLAGEFEPDPGIRVNTNVLLTSAALFLGVLAVSSAGVGWRRSAARRREPRPVTGTIRLSSPALSMGLNLAGDRVPGGSRLPVRPAVVGAIVGIAGLVGALTFGASLDRLVGTPRLYGDAWDLEIALQAEGVRISERELPALLADGRIEALARYRGVELRLGAGRPVGGMVLESVKGTVGPTTLRGRLPAGNGEVAVRATEPNAAEVTIGDSIEVSKGDQRLALRVVGLLPGTSSQGFVLTPEAASSLGAEEFEDIFILVNTGPGVDTGELQRDLRARFAEVNTPAPPEAISNIARVRGFPSLVAMFLAALALAGAGHLLVTAVRRRARDLAILKVIGFRRAQLRLTVLVQGLLVAGIGILAGIPLGVALGRTSWSIVASGLGVVPAWLVPVQEAVLVVPAAILASSFLALLPGERAARLKPATILHTE